MEKNSVAKFSLRLMTSTPKYTILNSKVAFLDVSDGLFLTTFLLPDAIFVQTEAQAH